MGWDGGGRDPSWTLAWRGCVFSPSPPRRPGSSSSISQACSWQDTRWKLVSSSHLRWGPDMAPASGTMAMLLLSFSFPISSAAASWPMCISQDPLVDIFTLVAFWHRSLINVPTTSCLCWGPMDDAGAL